MTLQEMFNKAVDHFADMDRPSMSTPSEYGGTDCAYRGHEGNKCIVGAFIDDEHYKHTFEGKGVLEYSTLWDSKLMETPRRFQPVLNAVAASMGVEALNDDQSQLLYKLQLIHDDNSDGFDIAWDNWYTIVEPSLIELAEDNGLEFNVG